MPALLVVNLVINTLLEFFHLGNFLMLVDEHGWTMSNVEEMNKVLPIVLTEDGETIIADTTHTPVLNALRQVNLTCLKANLHHTIHCWRLSFWRVKTTAHATTPAKFEMLSAYSWHILMFILRNEACA